MRLWKMAVPALMCVTGLVTSGAGCSSSSSSSGLTCKNPPSGGIYSSACNSCEQSMCASDFSAASSACSSFVSCVSGCDCSDLTCIGKCGSNQTSACNSAGTMLSECSESSCSNQCSDVVNSSSSGSSGGSSSGTSSGASSGGGTPDPSAFTAASSCYTMASGGNCTAINSNLGGGCASSMTAGLCPSAGLIGCCIVYASGGTTNIMSAECIYSSSASPTMSDCTATGGVWTTNAL